MVWGNWPDTCEKLKLKCVRPETIKCQENISSKVFDISLSNISLEYVSSSKENGSENKQMELHYTTKLLYSKGNHQENAKTAY